MLMKILHFKIKLIFPRQTSSTLGFISFSDFDQLAIKFKYTFPVSYLGNAIIYYPALWVPCYIRQSPYPPDDHGI